MTRGLGGNTASISLVIILLRVMDLRIMLLTLGSSCHRCLLLHLLLLLLLVRHALGFARNLLFYYRRGLLLSTRLALISWLPHVDLLPVIL
jgi:hypothetical protein